MGRRVIALGMAGWLAAALAGCAGESAYVKQLHSVVPQERFQAVLWLARYGSEEVIPRLIEALMDEDASVRWAAFGALRDRTGETMGYRPEASEGPRSEAVGRWQEWWQERQAAPAPKPDGPSGPAEAPGEGGAPSQQGEAGPAEGGTN